MSDPGLMKKYRIRAGNHILLLNAPVDFAGRLSDLPEGAVLVETAVPRTTYDIVQLFARDSSEVAQYFETAVAAVKGFGDDVTFGIRKTYIALQRGRQFGII